MKTTILFDLDGTLIDSTEAILESFHRSLKVLAHPDEVSDEQIKALIGHPLAYMFASIGVDPTKVEDHVATYKEHYRVISTQKTVLLPNAREAIEEASKFARLGIVTTKTGRYSRVLMEHFGVMHHFEALVGFEDVVNPKPHPEPIHKALSLLNVPSENVWMIGDTRLDIEASKRAGIECVAVSSGYENHEQLSSFTDRVEPDALHAVRLIAHKTNQ